MIGRPATRCIVEQAAALDVGWMMRCGGIQVGGHVAGEMRLARYDDDIDVEFESRAWDFGDGWLRLRYSVTDDWTGENVEIDDTLRLTTTRQHLGGRRWWFLCPRTNGRCRMLYLPLGAHHFRSRRIYRLGYAVEREGKYDRSLRRVRKLHLRLGGDPADGEHPDKPKRMRWKTYSRLIAEAARCGLHALTTDHALLSSLSRATRALVLLPRLLLNYN